MKNNDQDIIKQLQKGNEAAYKQLYSSYYVALCYHSEKILNDKYLAEEAVQTVFINIWDKRKKLFINSSLHSYLYKSVFNTSLNILKKENRLNQGQIDISELKDYLSISLDDGYSLYLAAEFDEKIKIAIKSLPKQCRQVFELSRYEGRKYNEIANELGISQNTVQKQISIALNKLRESLKSYIAVLYWAFSKK